MHLDWWTLGLQTVNFAVLVWLLNRFLYKPVLRVVDARRGEIERRSAEAAKAESEAAARRAALDGERAGMAAEREALLKQAASQAEEIAKTRRAQAESEAGRLVDAARKSLAAERAAARIEARRVAIDLGAEIARRCLAEIPASQRSEMWLQRVEGKLAVLAKPDLEDIRASLAKNGVVTVATALPMPAAEAEIWRSRLRTALGEAVDVAFETDPALVGGVELRFPNAVLHASWRDMLTGLRAELEPHDDAG
jgi:F-type H+-transporting ATPase subunit b